MKYKVFAASVFCVAIISSCGQNEGGGVRMEAAKPSLPAVSTPSTTTPILPGTNSQPTPTAPIIASSKLNPAHGQPGHRCDIAVGAPLPAGNSAVINTPAPTTASLNTTIPATAPIVQPQPVTTSNAAGLNPAHGQPGHRCDIPVGQPLNSKPQTASPTTATAATTPTATTAPPTPVKPDGNLAKGLNPAHGLPGHRCDIAVGQPLTTPKKS